MYSPYNWKLEEPWATIERRVGSLPYTTWHQTFGTIWLEVAKPEQACYSFPLDEVQRVAAWNEREFLARFAWHAHCQEMPLLIGDEEPLPGMGLLGVFLDLYLPMAEHLDDAFAWLQQQMTGNVLLPGERFVVYRRTRSLWSDLGWTRRQVRQILYLGPHPLYPAYVERERRTV